MSLSSFSVDFFCHVYDNFGDAGFCFRLARQLVNEYHARVRFIIDDIKTLNKFASKVDVSLKTQNVYGMEVFHWTKEDFTDASTIKVPNIVIEGIEAKLPPIYSQVIENAKKLPIWIFIDYLHVENWVERYHLSYSIGSRSPLKRICFFPGFINNSGGLLREKNVLDKRDAFLADKQMQDAFFKRLNINWKEVDKRIFLFCYPSAPIKEFFDYLSVGLKTVHCLIPIGVAYELLKQYFSHTPQVGETLILGQLTISIIPMVDQEDFDYLLALNDLNFVRGEESFVRAHWAQKPFIWQIYRQANDLHLKKLNSFLDQVLEGVLSEKQEVIRAFWAFWNDNLPFNFNRVSFWEVVETMGQIEKSWTNKLLKQDSLGQRLVETIFKEIKIASEEK